MKTLSHLSFSLSISRDLLFLDSDLEPASGSKGGSRGTTKRGTGSSERLVSSCRCRVRSMLCVCAVCARTHTRVQGKRRRERQGGKEGGGGREGVRQHEE